MWFSGKHSSAYDSPVSEFRIGTFGIIVIDCVKLIGGVGNLDREGPFWIPHPASSTQGSYLSAQPTWQGYPEAAGTGEGGASLLYATLSPLEEGAVENPWENTLRKI